MKTRIVISILLILVANIIVVAGCTSGSGSTGPLEYIEEGFVHNHIGEIRQYSVGVKSDKVEFDIDNVELEISHGISKEIITDYSIDPELGYIVTVSNNVVDKLSYDKIEGIYNSSEFYVLKKVQGEEELYDFYYETKRIGYSKNKYVYSKSDKVVMPHELFAYTEEKRDNFQIYFGIYLIMYNSIVQEYQLNYGYGCILDYEYINDTEIRFINPD